MSKRATGIVICGLLLGVSCGGTAVDVAGVYDGTCTGSMTVIAIPLPVNGTISFTLQPSGDIYNATGNLTVKRTSDGVVTYQATLGGHVEAGRAAITFTALDGKSQGTMTGDYSAGCWRGTAWTISGLATSGSGTWTACRR